MKTTIFTLIALLTCAFSFAQTVVTPEWVRNYSDRDSMTNIPSAIDANGNIYVTGSVRTMNQGYNFATIKYNQQGDTLWVKTYNGTANLDDEAVAIALDANGNIIVTGKSKNTNNDYDIVTIKYNTSGTVVFVNRYNGSANGNDIPSDVTTDNSGNVYTVGYSKQTVNYDYYITIKYTSTGTQSYVKTFNSTTSGNCRATSILWKNNRLFVTGFAFQNTGTYSVTTQSYIASNGVTLWTSNYGIISAIPPTPAKIVYSANNIYVSGTIGTNPNFDYSLVKYSSNNGAQQWATTYNAYGFNDFSTSVVLDNSGNIFVTGKAYNSNNLYEYHTLKYTPSGTLSWTNKYTTNLSDNAAMGTVTNKIAIDPYNMLYVCGSVKAGNTSDMLLYQLTASGNMVWDITYNGLANGIDAATDMVIDAQGRIFLTGQTQNGISKFDYTTVKLSQIFVYKPIDLYNEPRQSSFDYIKNKGQLINTNNALIPEIKYYVPNTYPGLFFTPKRLSFVFAKIDTVQATLDTLHRIDMTFANCNQLATIFPIDTTAGYTNYFLPQCPQGITGVKGSERLFVPNIYPNIDLHYYSNNAGLKMYFVLKPGANPKDIAMLFGGQNNLQINSNGELVITSSIGNTTFEKPHAYMVNFGQQIIPVNWQPQWQLQSSNKATITTGTWNGPFPLVIMVDKGHNSTTQIINMSLDWSTYFGGVGNEGCRDVKTNATNKVWVGGSGNNVNIPTFVGIYTNTTIGQNHCFIANFGQDAHPFWLTYFGGTGNDYLNEIAKDNDENVYAVGTTSSNDFPNQSSAGINYSTLRGGQDGFFIAFNNQGNVILCDSYIGGDGDDHALAIDFKQNGTSKIFAIGGIVHGNATNFPVQNTTGAYFQTTMGNNYSGFILKLDENYNETWGTLFAGNGVYTSIFITDVAISGTYTIAVCGHTDIPIKASSNPLNPPCGVPIDGSFPDCILAGAYNQSTYGGGNTDLFISEFNTQNQLIWSTFFGGNDADAGPFFALDLTPKFPVINFVFRDIYLTGVTACPSTLIFPFYPSSFTGAYNQNINSNTPNPFISRFGTNREQKWCTTFGGNGNNTTRIHGICEGPYQSVFFTGTSEPYNMPLPSNYCIVPPFGEYPICDLSGSNYMEIDPNSSYDRTFIAAFNNEDNLIWSTRFGNGNNNNGCGIAVSNNKLFIAGFSDQISNPLYTLQELSITDPLDYFQPYNAGGYDGTISRFDISDIFVNITENSFEQNNQFTISPNPAIDILNININNKNTSIATISIFDAIGKEVLVLSKNISSNYAAINIHKLNKGIYFIKCVDEKGFQYSAKFIKN